MENWPTVRAGLWIIGGFLFVYAVAWLFVFRSNANEIEEMRKQFETDHGQQWEKLFPEDGVNLAFNQRAYSSANTDLEESFTMLEEALSRPFPTPLVPPSRDQTGKRQPYVRSVLDTIRKQVAFQAGSRGVSLGESAAALGMELPVEMTEQREQDLAWLRQMMCARDVALLLFRLSENDAGEKDILAIRSIEPMEAKETGPTPLFIREHSVEVNFLANTRGVMRILHECARPREPSEAESMAAPAGGPVAPTPDEGPVETAVETSGPFTPEPPVTWIVQHVEIDGGARRLEPKFRQKMLPGRKREVRRWTEQYYPVTLRLARLETFSPEEGDVAPEADGDAPVLPIAH